MLLRIGPRQQECLSRASICREIAQTATWPESRAEYLKIKRSWLRLAGSRQLSERLKLFVADREHTRKAKLSVYFCSVPAFGSFERLDMTIRGFPRLGQLDPLSLTAGSSASLPARLQHSRNC